MKNEELDRIIEESFRAKPDFILSPDFARKVTAAVENREQWKSDLIDYLYIVGLILALTIFISVFYYFINQEVVLHIFNFISRNIYPVLLIGFILNFILFTDRVLLRLLFNKWSKSWK